MQFPTPMQAPRTESRLFNKRHQRKRGSINDAATQSILRAIKSIQDNIGEQITIDDMARTAMFSKFHFTRLFRNATGVSPGRFLSAIRLQEAKRLLLSTSLSVTEISHRVGYSSVGVCPTAYRDLRGFLPASPHDTQSPGTRSTTLDGELSLSEPDNTERTVFIGLFPDAIPQGTPARCTVLEGPGPFKPENVPEGEWYLLAQAIRPGEKNDPENVRLAMHGPVKVRSGQLVPRMRLGLRQMRPLDPPVLLTPFDAQRAPAQDAV